MAISDLAQASSRRFGISLAVQAFVLQRLKRFSFNCHGRRRHRRWSVRLAEGLPAERRDN